MGINVNGKTSKRSPWKFTVARGKYTQTGRMGNVHHPDTNPPKTGEQVLQETLEKMREKNWYLNSASSARPTGGLKWEVMRYLLHRWPLTSPFTNAEIQDATGANMKQVSWVLTQLKGHGVITRGKRGFQSCEWRLNIRGR